MCTDADEECADGRRGEAADIVEWCCADGRAVEGVHGHCELRTGHAVRCAAAVVASSVTCCAATSTFPILPIILPPNKIGIGFPD